MQALEFWKAVTSDRANLLESVIGLLEEHEIRYCVIGGQAVNAYAEPVVTLDLDLVVAVEQRERAEELLRGAFVVERLPHGLTVRSPQSRLRVQFHTDARYAEFVPRSERREILGIELPVAAVEDVLRGKTWEVKDPARKPSKRQEDLFDIGRLIDAHPHLREQVPRDILDRLI